MSEARVRVVITLESLEDEYRLTTVVGGRETGLREVKHFPLEYGGVECTLSTVRSEVDRLIHSLRAPMIESGTVVVGKLVLMAGRAFIVRQDKPDVPVWLPPGMDAHFAGQDRRDAEFVIRDRFENRYRLRSARRSLGLGFTILWGTEDESMGNEDE